MVHSANPSEGHGTKPNIQRNERAGKFDSDVREPNYLGLVGGRGDSPELRAGHTGGNGMVKAIKAGIVTAKDNPPHPTWQWIFSTAIMLVAGILGYIVVTISDVRVSLGVIGEIVTRVEASQTSHQNDPAKHGPR